MTPFRQRYLEDMQVRHLSPKTQRLSVECVSLSARHFHKSPELLGPDDIRAYQLYPVHDKQVSWSRFNQSVCALRFLYRITLGKDWAITHIPFPRKEHKLPVVLSAAEVAQFLGAITNRTYHMALSTAYAAGVRVSEVLHLHVPDHFPSPMRFGHPYTPSQNPFPLPRALQILLPLSLFASPQPTPSPSIPIAVPRFRPTDALQRARRRLLAPQPPLLWRRDFAKNLIR